MADIPELEKFYVKTALPRVYYLPNFISSNEETYLLAEIKKTPGKIVSDYCCFPIKRIDCFFNVQL